MTPATLKTAIEEAERFLKAAKAVKWITREVRSEDHEEGYFRYEDIDHPAAAAAKRASMDLTRALAQMRKSDH